ncbi:coiled-coil domain-containing protein 102A-like isoform X2 [Penaeus japonicus]|uniref:coiled-coil domain-containing protein 102A-like isoform X2 n=1 Tax=Penaeus japonicus TaxID=27405 RepID=UPI001C70D71B|nr:coiled-coil domain-containing protein 102A-like isoform X2 [Penaeus japonicus]
MAQSGGGSSRRGAQAPLPGAHPHPPPPHTHDPVSLPYHWHDKQELIQRELEEARARATQMEKTMRWWSDCTANWREKWSKVRSERNKAREEVRILRGRLEVSQRETGVLRREKNDLEAQMALISQTHMMRSRNKDDLVEKPTDLRDQNNHKGDSPERDGSTPARPITQTEAEKLSSDELQFIRDAKNTNFSLLEEMFGSRGSHHEESLNVEAGIPQSGVENVSVYAHKASEATRLSEKCRAGREVKDLICDEYLKDSAVKEMPENCHHPQRENDVEEKLIHSQQQEQAFRDSTVLPPTGSGNSSTQPSPSHRISTMSDPLPDTCHINPRISAVSDPMSEVCGGSECSEGGYEEPIRPSDTCANANPGVNRRGWRTNNGGSVMESSAGGSVIDDTGITPEQETLEQQVKMMKLRLEEATKTIQAERDEKLILHREVSKWQSEANELRARLEDIRASRQEAVKELVSLRTQHQKEVQCLQLEMLDEASSRECVDRRLADLRAELERLQEENAKEWGRRERLESEKIGMERDNKKLRAQVSDLEERLDKRSKLTASTPDSDVAQLKQEIADKYKELSELKHAHAKLKKVLADKSVELQHTTRRADQYESEVKRLRGRVEELKKELAASEDEVDGATNNIRKLQRGNDELQETVENLELQVEHLQSRLRSSQAASLPLRTANLLQDSDDDHAQF